MTNKFKVWDLPIRLFHWLLVVAIAGAWFTIEILEDVQLHLYAGYVVLALLIFRVSWGFVGPTYSRFSRLLHTPAAVLAHIRSFRRGSEYQPYAGHNPLGSLAVIALVAIVMLQVGTGLFSSDDYYFGPLAGWVDSDRIEQLTLLHKDNFEWLKILIALHIIAIALYRLFLGQRLTGAMFSGKKEGLRETDGVAPIKSDRLLLALILILISAFVTYAIVNWLAEPVPITDSYLY